MALKPRRKQLWEAMRSNLGRIPEVTMKDVKRQAKYNKALQKLMEAGNDR